MKPGKDLYSTSAPASSQEYMELKEKIRNGPKDKIYDIDLIIYHKPRKLVFISPGKAISRNRAVLPQILAFIFSTCSAGSSAKSKNNIVHLSEPNKAAGYLELENARVRWFLSLDYNDIPDECKSSRKKNIQINY